MMLKYYLYWDWSIEMMKCSICQLDIQPDTNGWAEGHNAWPVNEGRCCGKCNDNVVIPARLTEFLAREKAGKTTRIYRSEEATDGER